METRKEVKERKVVDTDLLFAGIDGLIQRAKAKEVLLLKRDKVVLSLICRLGLRRSEVLNLDTRDFDLDDFYLQGVVPIAVSRPHGPVRSIVTVDKNVVDMLDDYLECVRPEFRVNAGKDENALFLSSRGGRLSPSMLHLRFAKILSGAGLDGKDYGVHSLRYAGLLKMCMHIPPCHIHRFTTVNPLGTATFTFSNIDIPKEMLTDTGDEPEGFETSQTFENRSFEMPTGEKFERSFGHKFRATTERYVPDPNLIAKREPESKVKGKKTSGKKTAGSSQDDGEQVT